MLSLPSSVRVYAALGGHAQVLRHAGRGGAARDRGGFALRRALRLLQPRAEPDQGPVLRSRRVLADRAATRAGHVRLGDSADPTLPPPRQETKLASQATVPDGYCVVVGGLEVETATEAESRVPILGAVPLLGNLFKSQARRTTRSRFYVFLRCSVLRSSELENLRWISAPAMDVAGLEDDLPVVEPRLIR